jgi:hypothetical protein
MQILTTKITQKQIIQYEIRGSNLGFTKNKTTLEIKKRISCLLNHTI